jgi:hypothetical protein
MRPIRVRSRPKPSMAMRVRTADGRTFNLGRQRTGRFLGPASRAWCRLLLANYKLRRRKELREGQ